MPSISKCNPVNKSGLMFLNLMRTAGAVVLPGNSLVETSTAKNFSLLVVFPFEVKANETFKIQFYNGNTLLKEFNITIPEDGYAYTVWFNETDITNIFINNGVCTDILDTGDDKVRLCNVDMVLVKYDAIGKHVVGYAKDFILISYDQNYIDLIKGIEVRDEDTGEGIGIWSISGYIIKTPSKEYIFFNISNPNTFVEYGVNFVNLLENKIAEYLGIEPEQVEIDGVIEIYGEVGYTTRNIGKHYIAKDFKTVRAEASSGDTIIYYAKQVPWYHLYMEGNLDTALNGFNELVKQYTNGYDPYIYLPIESRLIAYANFYNQLMKRYNVNFVISKIEYDEANNKIRIYLYSDVAPLVIYLIMVIIGAIAVTTVAALWCWKEVRIAEEYTERVAIESEITKMIVVVWDNAFNKCMELEDETERDKCLTALGYLTNIHRNYTEAVEQQTSTTEYKDIIWIIVIIAIIVIVLMGLRK